MRETGVEDESLGLTEGVDHAVQEAHEKRGVETHRTRCVEQHDQPQRLDLAAPPGKLEERATMRDIAVNGAAQVEAAAAASDLLAADETRPHDAGKPRGEGMRRCHVLGIDDMAQVSDGQSLGARGAFTAATAIADGCLIIPDSAFYTVGQAERFLRY